MPPLSRRAFAVLLGAAGGGHGHAASSAGGGVPPPAGGPNRPTDLATIVQAARIDAAARSGVDAANTVVLSAETVTWRDSSLGCPEAGRMYMQALVPGWRIRIDAGGTRHDYHANRRGQWLCCAPGRAVEPVGDDPRR
jgi:hypothetical protein